MKKVTISRAEHVNSSVIIMWSLQNISELTVSHFFIRDASGRRKKGKIAEKFHMNSPNNWFPNPTESYKIVNRLSLWTSLMVIAQIALAYLYTWKGWLFKQPPWCAATDPCLTRKRSQVWFPGPMGVLCMHISPLFFLPSFFTPSPKPCRVG